MANEIDAIVVGLGASGAIIAEQLASSGMRVLGLDKGPNYTPEDFRFKHDELRYFIRGEMLPRMATDPITWRPNQRTNAGILPWAIGPYGLGDPLNLPPSIGTGGGSVHWTGASWRFREADFRMRSAIIERFGKKALPEGTTLVDWPITYLDLEPCYDRVEWDLGVSGLAGNVDGQVQPAGNPFEAPRRRGYPMPPLRTGAGDQRFVESCGRLGYHPFPQPSAIASIAYNGRSACVYCGYCHGYPCHVGAKQSANVTSIPIALASGNLEIRSFARVFRVDRDSDGHVTGVSYFGPDDKVHQVMARTVVIASYCIENTRLLLVSGINRNGQVGKHYMTHNYGYLTGTLADITNPFMGPHTAASVIDDFTSELVPDNDLGVLWGSPVTSFPGDVQPIEAIHNRPTTVPRWGAPLKEWLCNSYLRLHKLYSQTTNLPSPLCYADLDPNVTDRFGQPALRITHDWIEYDRNAAEFMLRIKRKIAAEMDMKDWWEADPTPHYHMSTHEVGMHRMGDDPATSVVDRYGEVHECRGLYAVGGGQFPTMGGYNPTETIQALAYWAADHIVTAAGGRLATNSNPLAGHDI